MDTVLLALDPSGCGCNGCCTGSSRPLPLATPQQVTDMLAGRTANHSGYQLRLDVQIGIAQAGDDRAGGVLSVTATALDWDDSPIDGCHWDLGPQAFDLALRHLGAADRPGILRGPGCGG